jgi:hypothetical protein
LRLLVGPYRTGTGDDPDRMAANVRRTEVYAPPLFRAGHIPIERGDALLRVGGASQGADLMVPGAKTVAR